MTPAARDRRQVLAPAILITTAAWSVLLFKPGGGALAASCCPPPTLGMALSADSLRLLLERNPPASLALGWLLMLAAMMAPMLATPVRHVLDHSFAQRRTRTVLLFLAAYVAVWMIAGTILILIALVLRVLVSLTVIPLVVAALGVLIWHGSPHRHRCLIRGHAHPALAAFGRAADIDALRFGLRHGFFCVGSCWGLMLLPELLARNHIAVMAAVTIWLLAERLNRPLPPRWRFRGVGKAARALLAQARAAVASGSAVR
jgi:predicted metal-binding membrane protein